MSSSIYYKGKCLYKGSGGILSNLSDRIMESVSPEDGVSDDVLAFIACLIHPSVHSLNWLNLDDLKVLTKLLIKTVNEFDAEGYFVIDSEEREYLIKHNISLDLPRSDKMQALELIKGLEEIIKEQEMA